MLRKFSNSYLLFSTDIIQRMGTFRWVHKYPADWNRCKDEPTSSTLRRIETELEEDKKKLQWYKQSEEIQTKFKLFESEEQNSDLIVFMQKPIPVTPKAIKAWWARRQEDSERFMQQYMPERHSILGPDLAAAHFLLFRGGAVKFTSSSNWMRANDKGEFDLPNKYDPAYKIQALKCDNVKLYYEGLENLRCLEHLKFLSFHNVKTFDDWCLDRVSGSQYSMLEVLDITGTKCTVNGLSCLYRVPTLKLLIVDDPKKSLEFELACAMLEESMPHLKICGAENVHDIP